jgi:prevent-host-death family protein
MKPSEAVKPISYLKAHASELIRQLSKEQKTLIITQNGEAKAILQDVRSFEQTQDSLAMLKILAQSNQSLNKGKVKPYKDSFQNLKKRIAESQDK